MGLVDERRVKELGKDSHSPRTVGDTRLLPLDQIPTATATMK